MPEAPPLPAADSDAAHAAPKATPAPQSRWGRAWKDIGEPVVFALVVTQLIATVVGVDGASMMPGLRHGERMLVPKYETWLHRAGVGDFHRGDVLIFKPPQEVAGRAPELTRPAPGGLWRYRPYLVKRLVGLPGDEVRIDGGVVRVNGQVLAEPMIQEYWKTQGCWDTDTVYSNHIQSPGRVEQARRLTVPAGHYFVLGDNRSPGGSLDSRTFGAVPLKDVAGRAAAVIWPPLRQVQAHYDCARLERHQDGVSFSGARELNLRALPAK